MRNKINFIKSAKSILFGVAIGDAVGAPAEFLSREILRQNPIEDMIGYGTHNQPLGTFSDDGSLTFCLAEALTHDFDLNLIAKNFVSWQYNLYWTARGEVFDVGINTQQAISRLAIGIQPELAGSKDVYSNGNGSLMRISPLLFYLLDKRIDERFEITKKVSSITHGHFQSIFSCFYYLEFARCLLWGMDKYLIYKDLQKELNYFVNSFPFESEDLNLFSRLLHGNIYELPEEQIYSTGYVLHTLEASIWCLLKTDNYKDAVLKAVNLGDDTDTTAAVTGGLAGLLYGIDDIPKNWIENLAKKDEIENLAEQLGNKYVCFKLNIILQAKMSNSIVDFL